MTLSPEQDSQFTSYGCIARSIMLLAAAKGRPISREDFCQQFQHLFIISGQYGALIPSQIVDVVRPLGLGTYFQTYRRYEEILDVFTNQKRSVLVSSEINLNAGATDVIRHFSLLTCIDSTRFSIITPTQNAGDIPKDFVVADWDTKMFHGICLL